MTTWGDRLQWIWSRIKRRRRAADLYLDMRSMALDVNLATLHTPLEEPWSGASVAMMEIGVPEGTATILAVADGTVSMYVSSGGGVIGAGEHEAVRSEGKRFRAVVADSRGLLTRTAEFPLPKSGEVRFQARIGDDRFTGVGSEADLVRGRHPLSPLYAAGQDLLTEIRLASEPLGG